MGYDIPIENFYMFLESQDLIDFAIEFNDFDMAYMEQQKRWRKKYKNEYCKEYRKQNKEKLAKQKKEYYEQNKEKRAKQKKEYREQNKEKIAEYKKEYYERNRARCRKCIHCTIGTFGDKESLYCNKLDIKISKIQHKPTCEYYEVKENVTE